MRAELVDETDTALSVAKPEQLFAEQLHPHRFAVRLGQFAAQERRDPVASQHIAHRRSRPDAGDQFIVFW
jgi:hypothetical protein